MSESLIRKLVVRYAPPQKRREVSIDECVVCSCALDVACCIEDSGKFEAEDFIGVIDNLFVLQASEKAEVGDVVVF